MVHVTFTEGELKSKDSSVKAQTSALTKVIRNSVALNFGDLGIASIPRTMQIRYWSPELSVLVLRTSRDSASVVWSAMTLVSSPVIFRCLHIAGSIRLLKRRFLNHVNKCKLPLEDQEREEQAMKALTS